MSDDQMVVDDPARDEMFLDDPLEDRGITCAVPSTFWVHDGNRPAFADAQAVGLRAQDAALLGQLQLLQPALEKRPGFQAAFLVAALRLLLVAAEEDMAPRDRHADVRRDIPLGLGHGQEVYSTTQGGPMRLPVLRVLTFAACVLAAANAPAQYGNSLSAIHGMFHATVHGRAYAPGSSISAS